MGSYVTYAHWDSFDSHGIIWVATALASCSHIEVTVPHHHFGFRTICMGSIDAHSHHKNHRPLQSLCCIQRHQGQSVSEKNCVTDRSAKGKSIQKILHTPSKSPASCFKQRNASEASSDEQSNDHWQISPNVKPATTYCIWPLLVNPIRRPILLAISSPVNAPSFIMTTRWNLQNWSSEGYPNNDKGEVRNLTLTF